MDAEKINISELSEANVEDWDRFVTEHNDGSFFHLSGWKSVFEKALGHRTTYLLAQAQGDIVGILPLVCVDSLLFGKTLSSLPFCSYGGCLSESLEATTLLEAQAVAIGRELGVGSVEFRARKPGQTPRQTKELYEYFTKPIDADPEANMKAIRSKQRNIIRKGIKNGLVSRVDSVENFYRAYSESVRNLGTPVFPIKLFREIASAFPQSVEFFSAYKDDEIVSSSMLYYFRNEVCPYYWGGVEAARNLKGNDFLCWEIMCRAAERGSTLFDFGRSKKETGSYQWKVNLGFESHPLHYEYELIKDDKIPDINPLNPKYRLFVQAWKHLPLPVSRLIGPLLAKNLG